MTDRMILRGDHHTAWVDLVDDGVNLQADIRIHPPLKKTSKKFFDDRTPDSTLLQHELTTQNATLLFGVVSAEAVPDVDMRRRGLVRALADVIRTADELECGNGDWAPFANPGLEIDVISVPIAEQI